MLARDFCYWLQGYFEIDGESKNLTDKQVNIIKKHLAMVLLYDKKESKSLGFVMFLQGMITMLPKHQQLKKGAVSSLVVAPIIDMLNEVFEHEIDLEAGEQSNELNAIHNKPNPDIFSRLKPGQRC